MNKNYDQYRMDRFAAYAAKVRERAISQSKPSPQEPPTRSISFKSHTAAFCVSFNPAPATGRDTKYQ